MENSGDFAKQHMANAPIIIKHIGYAQSNSTTEHSELNITLDSMLQHLQQLSRLESRYKAVLQTILHSVLLRLFRLRIDSRLLLYMPDTQHAY